MGAKSKQQELEIKALQFKYKIWSNPSSQPNHVFSQVNARYGRHRREKLRGELMFCLTVLPHVGLASCGRKERNQKERKRKEPSALTLCGPIYGAQFRVKKLHFLLLPILPTAHSLLKTTTPISAFLLLCAVQPSLVSHV